LDVLKTGSLAEPGRPELSLSDDGPDPGADPVGHAQEQMLPLRQLTISEEPRHRAIDALASASSAVASGLPAVVRSGHREDVTAQGVRQPRDPTVRLPPRSVAGRESDL
jgi:hypothetical protein